MTCTPGTSIKNQFRVAMARKLAFYINKLAFWKDNFLCNEKYHKHIEHNRQHKLLAFPTTEHLISCKLNNVFGKIHTEKKEKRK